MLKFLFHRESFIVRLMEFAGLTGAVLILWRIFKGQLTFLEIVLFALVMSQYLFLRICAVWPVYTKKGRDMGIKLHLVKAMVPTSYILAGTTWLFIWSGRPFILILSSVLLAVICHVNVILLKLHRKDNDPVPVNFFSMTH